MGKLILIIICASVLTAVLYTLINKVSPFKDRTVPLTGIQKTLCYFMVLYVPVQLFIMLTAGHHLPIANPKGHEFIAIAFTLSHALLSLFGMVVSSYFYKRNKSAMSLLVINASTAIFYFMSAIIFITR